MDAATFRITIGPGVPFGMNILDLSINSSGAVMPHNVAQSNSNFITVLINQRYRQLFPQLCMHLEK
jgi:hypothetical protein